MLRENIQDLISFAVVAEERSFTKAAARLDISQSALSHAIRGLEERLGIRLLDRTTRSVAPTSAGERLLADILGPLSEIRRGLGELADMRERPAGLIRITASEYATQTNLLPKLIPFLKNYPDVKVEISVDKGFRDIVADRFDAGVREGDVIAKDMIAVKIGPDLRSAVVASPDYFKTHPKPETPHDLIKHNCINIRLPTLGGLYAWEFERKAEKLRVRVDGQFLIDTTFQKITVAVAGLGLAYLPEDAVAAELADGRLIRVLDDWCEPYPGSYLYYPSRKHHPPAFRLLVEALRYPGRD